MQDRIKTEDAIAFFGNIKKMADALGIYPQGIYRWGEFVPPLRHYQISEMMNRRPSGE